MIRKIFRKNNIYKKSFFVEPDEIFLDAKNIQNFNSQQFEGRIEKPISKKNILFLGIFFLIFTFTFIGRLGYLQIEKGQAYFQRSENNTFEKTIIFADRGIIYDRNMKELAWNTKVENSETLVNNEASAILNTEKDTENKEDTSYSTRTYRTPGFSHVLGYVNTPSKDKSGRYWQTEFIGKDGLEKQYGDLMLGTNGAKVVETDAHGKILYQNIVNPPQRGAELVTTMDAELQSELFKLIKNLAESKSFAGGAGVIMDIDNGEVLASTSFPEYDSQVLSDGKNTKLINSYLTDKRKVFLDRTISGLYTPGSILKPFFALGALTEGIISPEKKILSTGSISIPNKYDPTKPTIFKDWKAHGWTDMRESIAVSSDVYFYSIGGGFEGQKGMGISGIEKYSKLFQIGTKTGVDLPDEKSGIIPNPEWKLKNFNNEPWRIGNTYHTAIGQYGFQVTLMEMTRATGALANYGTLVTPHFLLNTQNLAPKIKIEGLKKSDIKIIHEGMRMTVTNGTAVNMNVPYVKVAAKTGTAQLGVSKKKVNSWVVGFFPYENPKYAFTIMMEAGPSAGTVGASSIMRGLLDWMHYNTPEYLGLPPKKEEVKPQAIETPEDQTLGTEEVILDIPEIENPIPNTTTE